MPTSTRKRFRLSIMLVLALIAAVQIVPARAASTASLDVLFENLFLTTITIGQTLRLNIELSFPGPNPVRATSLECFQSGTSLSGQSISRLPNSTVFPARSRFQSEQYYRAVSGGTTNVWCVFKGIDTVTGELVQATSAAQPVDVSAEQRLFVYAYTNTRSAPVGEPITLTVLYGNRGPNTLTNVEVSCDQLGRGIAFEGKRQTQTTVQPGQSGFVQYTLVGRFSGASGLFFCLVTATDSVTHETISLYTPTFPILIR